MPLKQFIFQILADKNVHVTTYALIRKLMENKRNDHNHSWSRIFHIGIYKLGKIKFL